MGKIIVSVFALVSVFFLNVFAGETAGIDEIIQNQSDRIEQGVNSGALSAREAGMLRKELGSIRAKKNMMLEDGVIDNSEDSALRGLLDETGKKIFVKKHNEAEQPVEAGADEVENVKKTRPHVPGGKADDKDMAVSQKDEQQAKIQAGIDSGEITESELAKILMLQSDIRKMSKTAETGRKNPRLEAKIAGLNDELDGMIYEFSNNFESRKWESRVKAIEQGQKAGDITDDEAAELLGFEGELKETMRLMLLDRRINEKEQKKLDSMYAQFDEDISKMRSNGVTAEGQVRMKRIQDAMEAGELTKDEVKILFNKIDSINKAREILQLDDKMGRSERKELAKMTLELDEMIDEFKYNDDRTGKAAAANVAVKKESVAVKNTVAKKASVKKIEKIQEKSILAGIVSGELTNRELGVLNAEKARIEAAKMKMMRDGILTDREKAELRKMEEDVLAKIQKLKNNREKKWWQIWR